MGKLFKGLFKFTVAAAAVGGIAYAFKDQIKESQVYKDYDVDGKIKKVKTTIKEKIQAANADDDFEETDDVEDDITSEDAGYVSLDTEGPISTIKQGVLDATNAIKDMINETKETEENKETE